MKALLLYIVGAYLLFGLTYVFYIFVMRFKTEYERGTVTTGELCFLLPWAVVGLVLDFLVCWFIGVPLFVLDFHFHLTMTSRLKRWKKKLYGSHHWRDKWNSKVAMHICDKWLDKWDPDGNHC